MYFSLNISSGYTRAMPSDEYKKEIFREALAKVHRRFFSACGKRRGASSAGGGAIQSDIDEADELPITQCALIN